MSFITKRERVFNDYDLFDLPARNEGKLKAYASCTDARAWSHFCSDKSEHLVEIIKRNNDTCRPKYLPTDVIVETLMVAKNAEIGRLKHKIEEFEQLLSAYDELDLTCEQKCEIANAHAAIKAANKELDELCLDLDLSGYTEGIDSEAFETGKSRGDEPSRHKADETPKSKGEEWTFERDSAPKMETKCNQTSLSCPCDASTSATDPRVEEMQGDIIAKDAKLNAMQNTIAIMENDICEPYCIYAHINTALEKIFATLCQNDKYKQYLDLLTAGKDTRCIDIKGKILFKLKIFEKFCLALIAPCSQDINDHSGRECSCYRAEIVARVETTFALTSSESKKPSLDNKRAQLVADIIHNDEMKEILSKDSTSNKDETQIQDDIISVDNYSIDGENLKRLKLMHENYDDLMTCYESLKHEKNCLKLKCDKYKDLEEELESLRYQLREYNTLWTEKEYYKDRSVNLDDLKQQYLLLSNEATNLETQLEAETQINKTKSQTIDELRKENILLEKKLNEASIAFEQDKNTLLCKLNETECKVMCREQQIKSLSLQINRLLEQYHEREANTNETNTITLLDQIEEQREQIRNLKEALFCNEEEKQNLQNDFHDKIKFINELKMEIEKWKSTYDKTVQSNQYLEKYIDDIKDELKRLTTINQTLSQEVKEKTTAVENLIDVVNNKSQEVNRLMSDLDTKSMDNEKLLKTYQEFQEKQIISFESLEKEKTKAIASLQIAKQESQELLQKVKNCDDMVHKQNDTLKPLKLQVEKYNEVKEMLLNTMQENKCLKDNLISQENKYSVLVQEVQGLRESKSHTINDVNRLQNERDQYKMSYELTKKVSEELENKLSNFENLRQELNYLQESREQCIEGNKILENELYDKTIKLNSAINSFELSKKESSELLDKIQQYNNLNEDLNKLRTINETLSKENLNVTQDLANEKKNVELLTYEIKKINKGNAHLLEIVQNKSIIEKELIDLKISYDELLTKKTNLQNDFDNKTKEINNLHNTLKDHSLKQQVEAAINNIKELETDNLATQNLLSISKKENTCLIDKMKEYETLQTEFNNLANNQVQIKTEKELLEKELMKQTAHLNKMEKENHELHSYSQDLEKSLIISRSEDSVKPNSIIQIQDTAILNEIEEMKKEKLIDQSKIRDLLNKLDESEIIISDLSEQILARNDKIAVLENHLNELEDEVRQLHNCLDEVVNAGEEIKDNSFQQIDQSLKKMEAHHSKATHNMKIELSQLHNINYKLENQLSFTKLKNEDIIKDRHQYVSQIINLQNEREIIVTDIKQLELSYVGDSILSPGKCDIEDILTSLERIQKYLDAKTSRINSLEQTLFQVQASSQLLLGKAEEAKKIVENEKQKIINEKEEVLRERLNIEKQLVNLKETLEKQISCDQDIIRDLEAEILNKDLIIDKVNKSTEIYISKLEEEIGTMKEMYENSLKKLENFQQDMQTMSEKNKKNVDIINKINMELQEKCKEVDILQESLEKIKNMSKCSLGIQTLIIARDVEIQTEKLLQNERSDSVEKQCIENKHKLHVEKTNGEEYNIKPNFINEVQVLNAKIDPTFNYVKNIYLSYKMKQLDRCKLEQYSISCLVDDIHGNHSKILSTSTQLYDDLQESHQTEKYLINYTTDDHNLINIYKKNSMYTDSSRIFNNDERDTTFASNPSPKTPTKLSTFTELNLTNECFDIKPNIKQDNISNLFNYSDSGNSTEKDIFVIYQDNESNDTPETQNCIEAWISKGHPDISVEACTGSSNKYKHNYIKKELPRAKENSKENSNYKDTFLSLENLKPGNNNEKNKLSITLPMVEIESTSVIISNDKKAADFEKFTVHPFLKRISTSSINVNDDVKKIKHKTSLPSIRNNNAIEAYYTNANKNIVTHASAKGIKSISSANLYDEKANFTYSKNGKRIVVPKKGNVSYHNLLRVDDADTLSPKNRKNSNIIKEHKIYTKQEVPENFGIKYILDTINCEIQPDYIKMYGNNISPRETRSDERIRQKLSSNCIDPRPSGLRRNKFSSSECKSETNLITSKLTIKEAPQTTFQERSVMVKIDSDHDYENKIQNLTKLLENTERDYKKKIEAIKMQYDNNVKCIINDHNEGVKTIQSIHEETFRDILKVHENEIENLRSMSMEAMRKADKLEKENQTLKTKILDRNSNGLDEEPIRDYTPDIKRCQKCHNTRRTLTKTNIEAFNVKPKVRSHGPCTCSLEVNISETIRNIFEQVDAEQRRLGEHTYLKYIANKIINDNVEALDTKELSFLHLKVCRTWKTKMTKEEALQKRIDLLENELMHKQLHAQQHMANLDREVTEERRRLQELREAVCRKTPPRTRAVSPGPVSHCTAPPPTPDADKELNCKNLFRKNNASISERRSAGDLVAVSSNTVIRNKRLRMESNRAVLVKLDSEERRQKKLYSDEPPTRLRKSHDRQALRSHKKL